MGEEISKVKKAMNDLRSIIESQVWDMGQGYIELIRILSLGVLLRIDKSQMKTLENKIRQEKLNDYFINFLLKINKEWKMTNTQNSCFPIYMKV